MPGGWISPHVVDCFSKSMNKEQMFKGRQGLLQNHEIITHVVSREDMVRNSTPKLLNYFHFFFLFITNLCVQFNYHRKKLMDPLLDHSKCIQMFDEQSIGFNLQSVSLVMSTALKHFVSSIHFFKSLAFI